MSSEVCPFCGKTYKRLKSHLPHCKAAASSKTPQTKHDVNANQTTSSSHVATALSESTAKSTTESPKSKRSKKTSVVSTSAETQSASSASFPPSTKKKKQKLSEQTNTPSSTCPASPSLSPSPTVSKPKKQSLRALIEAAKSKEVSQGSLEGTTKDQTPYVADTLSTRTTAETKTNPEKDSIEDNAHPAFLSTDTKPKTKASKTKKAAQSLHTTKSSSLDSEVKEKNKRSRVGDDLWLDSEGEVDDLTVKKMPSNSRRVTLQDVKAALGRVKTTQKYSKQSILRQIETTDDLSSKIKPGTSLSPVPPPTGSLKKPKTLPDQLTCTSPQPKELQLVKRESKQASLVALKQLDLTSPAAPLLSGHASSQVSKATPPPGTVGLNEALKVTGLLTLSPPLTNFSSPLPAARAETLRADDGWKSQIEVKTPNTADEGTKGALTQRRLGQVRLRELPEWLACKTPSHPREVVEMVQRGWQWYYRRYIDVKKGGVGGVGMLLAGYCVLSYIWRYPHLKQDRWRKYH
ncbi:uncharacterized protein C17orf80 homolog [Plectropomus leopardus]|uniref:uncharacterized protein C17orf80 homolog n=1 Tax=Plectropomus leopardus TaxID=160734 RepID=UPI001C4D58ED|nr:uncharacterized protein C17orf80 homolog [Plectropomus leopardus]XP_042363657.1 uncharacterized protein C17orf80 homolog [Plectropomus leopardus]XP_042363658.1 uncharacterized protein C17orf80 homolog [Plectropomus leopardus]XP_042363659.1 uncharacterized protein C17orf80 homolog [Plectropomus leopardus]XP_042363660.1 uncharacterized protein C17orf80 homolog [Plectropomus leopardus]